MNLETSNSISKLESVVGAIENRERIHAEQITKLKDENVKLNLKCTELEAENAKFKKQKQNKKDNDFER